MNRELLNSLAEARAMTENYRQEYNKIRPYSSLNYMDPETFILYQIEDYSRIMPETSAKSFGTKN